LITCIALGFNGNRVFAFAAHVDNEVYLGRALERLGDAALKEQEPDIGAAFFKFAVVTKELSALMKTLVRHLKATLMSHVRDDRRNISLRFHALRFTHRASYRLGTPSLRSSAYLAP